MKEGKEIRMSSSAKGQRLYTWEGAIGDGTFAGRRDRQSALILDVDWNMQPRRIAIYF